MLYKILFITMMMFSAFADTVDVKLSPLQPLAGESFNLVFEIETNSEETPSISFDPGGLEVLGRNHLGVQSSMVIINGRISKSRTVKYAYELIGAKARTFWIKDIEVDIAGNKLKHKKVKVKLLKEPVKSPDIFATAELDKEKAYVGEGVILNYYLYSSYARINYEILKFPKLAKFLKRFYDDVDVEQRVAIGNNVYLKKLIYRVKLFPNKAGKFRVDPIKLKVIYMTNTGFGSYFGSQRKKTVSSKSQSIEAIALPTKGMPTYFSGLVGKHDFKLIGGKDKYLVNEAVELKFEVTGEGALEEYSPPAIYKHADLEEFETNSNLKSDPSGTAKKTFDFTYLPRASFKIDKKLQKFAYFDPSTLKYVDVSLDVPKIEVVGGAVLPNNNNKPLADGESVSTSNTSNKVAQPIVRKIKVLSPSFIPTSFYNNYSYFLSALLVIINLSLILLLYIKVYRPNSPEWDILIEDIRKNGLTYSKLFNLINFINSDNSNKLTTEIIADTSISSGAKEYFLNLVKSVEQNTYGQEKVKSFSFKRKFFNELSNFIKHENIQ